MSESTLNNTTPLRYSTFNKSTKDQLDLTKPTLYMHFASPPSRAIWLVLEHSKLLDRINVYEVDALGGEWKSSEFLEINPFGTIPALTHIQQQQHQQPQQQSEQRSAASGIVTLKLFESTAILEYLNELFKLNGEWGFDNNNVVSKYKQINLLHKYHNLIPPAQRSITIPIYATAYQGVSFDVDMVKQNINNVKLQQLHQLEGILVKNGGWLIDGKPSAVDALYAMELYQLGWDAEYSTWTWGVLKYEEQFPVINKWLLAIRDSLMVPNSDIYNTHVVLFGEMIDSKLNGQHKLSLF